MSSCIVHWVQISVVYLLMVYGHSLDHGQPIRRDFLEGNTVYPSSFQFQSSPGGGGASGTPPPSKMRCAWLHLLQALCSSHSHCEFASTTVLPRVLLHSDSFQTEAALPLGGLFCDQFLQGQKVIAFPAVPVWQGLWVVLGLLCTGSSVRTWSSTSYLSSQKCGRGVFLSQHLFAFPMQIPSSGFSIPLNLWAQLFSLMDMKTHDGSPLQPLTAWRLPAKCIFDLWLRLPFPCSCFLFSTISYLFLVTTYCAMLTWRINNYLDGPQ